MTSPVPGAHVMRNSVITLTNGAADTFQVEITKARLVPDTPIKTLRTLGNVTLQDIDTTAWTLELSGVQVHGAGGLAKFLTDNEGAEVTVEIQPRAGAGQETATALVVAMPVEFGGEQGNYRTFDKTFPVVGTPVFSTSA